MPVPLIGLLAGLLVAIATAAGGFTGFLIALVFGAIGYVAGLQLDGSIDLSDRLKSKRG